jgi:hypothetical protein
MLEPGAHDNLARKRAKLLRKNSTAACASLSASRVVCELKSALNVHFKHPFAALAGSGTGRVCKRAADSKYAEEAAFFSGSCVAQSIFGREIHPLGLRSRTIILPNYLSDHATL